MELIDALLPQVAQIHVIDNSISDESGLQDLVSQSRGDRVRLWRLGQNFGIAKALNVGIELARQAGASHVLLSDQDSLPEPDMVTGLVSSYEEVCLRGDRVGAVGPTFTDLHTGITFPFQAQVRGKFFYGHVRPDADNPIVEALSLITSGTLIPIRALDDIGGMREDLFIDKVDIEWCHRARARGWKVFGTSRAVMSHRMGDNELRVWYFGWRREIEYSPLRLYYQTRNFIALIGSTEIAWRWKVRNAWYTFGVVYGQVIFGKQRRRALAMALRGLLDGVRGRMGPHREA